MKKQIICCLFLFSFVVHSEGFIAGTLVKIPSGYIEIQNIKVGDMVSSCDFKNHCVAKAVTEIFQKEAAGYLEIHMAQSVIGCDEDHPFYSPVSKNWILAKNLRRSTQLMPATDQKLIEKEIYYVSEKVRLYTLSIADQHNFYVTGDDVLVHNRDNMIESTSTVTTAMIYGAVSLVVVSVATYFVVSSKGV